MNLEKLNLVPLNEQEMKDTQGGVLLTILLGAALGFFAFFMRDKMNELT